MGTRSRLVIRRSRSGKKSMNLWMKWDGYFDGVGAWLCAELKKLLQTYTIPEIRRMIDSLDLEDDKDGQNFNTKDLIPFLEGKTKYKNDPCDDIEFEYVLDADLGIFIGEGHEEYHILNFEQLRAGNDFTNIRSYEEEKDKVNMLVENVNALNEAEKLEFLERIKHLMK